MPYVCGRRLVFWAGGLTMDDRGLHGAEMRVCGTGATEEITRSASGDRTRRCFRSGSTRGTANWSRSVSGGPCRRCSPPESSSSIDGRRAGTWDWKLEALEGVILTPAAPSQRDRCAAHKSFQVAGANGHLRGGVLLGLPLASVMELRTSGLAAYRPQMRCAAGEISGNVCPGWCL